jgi:hypothetical protein
MVEFSKIYYFLGNDVGRMTGNVVLPEVDVCRTKQGIKTRLLWRISWYYSVYNVINETSHKTRWLSLCLKV